jgi:hypothetical protein
MGINERQRGSTYLGDVRACSSWKILKSKVPEMRFPAFEAKIIPNSKQAFQQIVTIVRVSNL